MSGTVHTDEQKEILRLWKLGFNTQEIADKVFPVSPDREARVYNMLSFVRLPKSQRRAA